MYMKTNLNNSFNDKIHVDKKNYNFEILKGIKYVSI